MHKDFIMGYSLLGYKDIFKEKVLSANGNTIIYGAGTLGRRALEYFGDELISAFCDSDRTKVNKIVCGKKIISIEELCENKFLTIIAIRNRENVEIVQEKLENNGIQCLDLNLIENEVYEEVSELAKKRPLHFNIETINFCPLKCVFCVNRKLKRNPVVMSNEVFENLVKQYAETWGGTFGICSTQSDFFSDPLVFERVRVIKKYKRLLWVHSTTPLISAAKYTDSELVNILSIFDFLEISVDGYDKENYLMMTGIDGFDILRKQLYRLHSIIKRYELKIDIWLSFRTNNMDNCKDSLFYNELSDMWKIMDLKTSYFSWFGSISQDELPKGAKLLHKDNRKVFDDCVIACSNLSIQADGRAVGCGCIDWLTDFSIGNANEQTLKEIWLSKEALDFRNAFSKHNTIPRICERCELYTSVNVWKNIILDNYKSENGLYYYIGN